MAVVAATTAGRHVEMVKAMNGDVVLDSDGAHLGAWLADRSAR